MTAAAKPDPVFEALLEFLKRSRGFDFTGYKRGSLERRFRRRMETIGCESFGDYIDYLEVHPEEYERLFDALLINVTEFFRDPAPWECLRAEALPALLAAKGADEPIRVWSAGCATGQEPCTIAIVLAELLGPEQYAERVKIYATDIDEEALAAARAATYTTAELESVPEDLRERYFERRDQRHVLRPELRHSLIFGRNNLTADAPISRVDLLVCRNTLMYFTAEAQARILRRMQFALRDHGILMLGRSEMMVAHRDRFEPLYMEHRLFRRVSQRATLGSRVAGMPDGVPDRPEFSEEDRAALDAVLEITPQAQLVVSRSGRLTFANVAARALFGIAADGIGTPFDAQPVAHEPAALTGAVEQALRERRRIAVGEVGLKPVEGEERRLEITALPLLADGATAIGVLVVFEDVTPAARLAAELEGNRNDLQAAYQELESTIDELETTNEELQSANEELQTTNEELQSTNEELEAMNEELQSTNEELETINDELRERSSQLDRVNEFLEGILGSLGLAVIVLDRNQRVMVWNRGAQELWGLRPDEALDEPFLGLDIGLPSERIAPALRAVLRGASAREETLIDAVNRRGRAILCLTTIVPLSAPAARNDGDPVRGAILMMEESNEPAADPAAQAAAG